MKRVFWSLGSVTALWTLAVVQPVVGPLGRSPEFFVAHHADAIDIGLFVALLVLLPAVAFGAVIGIGSAVGRRTGDAVTALLIGLLTAVLAAQTGYRAGVAGWPGTLLLAASVALVAISVWWLVPLARTYLAALTPAIVIVPLVFVSSADMRSLLWPEGNDTAGAAVSGNTPVVVVVFDELSLVSLLAPDGSLDPVRYPHITALAHDGIWFDHATTVSEFTRWALPAIMTGRYPRPNTTPVASNHPESIFTALSPRYRMEVHEWDTHVCPADICGAVADSRFARVEDTFRDARIVAAYALLPPAARAGLPSLTEGWANFGGADGSGGDTGGAGTPWTDLLEATNRLRDARSFLEAISAGNPQPTLYFLHTMLTHHPPRWVPSGQIIANRVQVPPRFKDDRWPEDPWPALQWYQGHMLQAGLADTVAGWLTDRLVRAGLYDRALIVITADHGVSYRPGDAMRYLTDTNVGDILPVPLIVKLPAADGSAHGIIDHRNVQTVDILPTIADALRATLPWSLDGRSALGPPGGPDKRVYVKRASRFRRFSTDEVARLEREALVRQSEIFGAGKWPSPRLPGFDDLVGQAVASTPIVEDAAGVEPQLANPEMLEQVDLAAPTLPVQVVGSIAPASRAVDHPIGVAVAVNGQVAAMTTTVPGSARWYALIPPSLLRQGANRLRAFLLDPSHPGSLVRRAAPETRDPNLALGGATLWGVRQQGFHKTEKARDTFFRWTDGRAVIGVPIDPARPPERLSIATVFSGRPHKRLRVLVDGCEALATALPSGAWSQTVALKECVPAGYWADIEIVSDTHVPDNDDPRRLGVALASLTLE